MESLTTIAKQQQQQQLTDEDDDDDDDDQRTLDRLASFAAISDTSIASRRRLLQRRHLATGRRLSLPDTITDIRKADSYVVFAYTSTFVSLSEGSKKEDYSGFGFPKQWL